MSYFDEAKKYIPGGVNSPVRAFGSVGGEPFFVSKGKGSHIWDTDNNEYIDYVCSWGPMILGHCDKDVNEAVIKAVENGTSYGAPTVLETELAEKIVELMPSVEKVRMVSSGTEAVMSALRLARGYTKRDKIIKFEGCYHGHSDFMLVKAGSGLLTFGETSSPGVPQDAAKNTIIAQYNDLENVAEIFKQNKNEIACLIVEPVAANMGVVLPKPGFLEGLRKLCDENGALLIFDEVITGFRLSAGGAQKYFGINPDITTMGKIIGGGMPVGAYGGRSDIMDMVSPAGPVYQAGTLSGNPLAMTAGLATLSIISADPQWGKADYTRELTIKTKHLLQGITKAAKDAGVKVQIHQAGSMFGIFFNENDVYDYETSAASNQEAFGVWFMEMLSQGIYLAPSQFETLFMSGAHSDDDIVKTIDAAEIAMRKVAQFLQK